MGRIFFFFRLSGLAAGLLLFVRQRVSFLQDDAWMERREGRLGLTGGACVQVEEEEVAQR